MNYLGRPKIILEPHYWNPEQNVKLLGFIVRNMGRSIAERVYGTVQYDRSKVARICWNDSLNYQIDILPGPLNECWFYVAKLKKVDESVERYTGSCSWWGPAKDYCEITIKLTWKYHRLKSITRKYSLNLATWNESKIMPKNKLGRGV